MLLLSTLHLEILLEIIRQVDALEDLDSLGRTNRLFHGLVDIKERRLYHRIRLRTWKHQIRAYPLLINLLKEKRLRHYVRELEASKVEDSDLGWPWWTTYFECRVNIEAVQANEDTELLLRALRDAGVTDDEDELGGGSLGTGRPVDDYLACALCCKIDVHTLCEIYYHHSPIVSEVLAMLFMSVAPDLRHLRLHGFTGEQFPIDMFLKRVNAATKNRGTTRPSRYPSGESPFLQNLRTVDIYVHGQDSRNIECFDLLNVLRHFHRLPSIERFAIGCICHMHEKPKLLVPGTSNISKIHITTCCVEFPYLATIINHSKELTEFSYLFGEPNPDWVVHPFVCRLLLREALLQHSKTLRILDLDCDDDFRFVIRPDGDGDEDRQREAEQDLRDDSDYEESCVVGDKVDSFRLRDKNPRPSPSNCILPLTDFTALTSLHIGIYLLLGAHMHAISGRIIGPPPTTLRLAKSLPPNLRSLHIRGYDKAARDCSYCVGQIYELLDEWKSGRIAPLQEISGVQEPTVWKRPRGGRGYIESRHGMSGVKARSSWASSDREDMRMDNEQTDSDRDDELELDARSPGARESATFIRLRPSAPQSGS